MSDTCPVVTIQTPAGPTRINESDFDPAKHVLCDETGAAIEAAKPVVDASGQATLGNPTDPAALPADLEFKTVPELRALAEDHKIDLGDATKKADIIAAIEAAKKD